MNKVIVLLLSFVLLTSFAERKTTVDLTKSKAIIVWQPSHQTDTGVDFSEAATCNAIVEAALAFKPRLKEFKVWSLDKPNLHHANVGSNTIVAHTTAIVAGQLSGYAYELQESNKKKPDVFIAVHNNGGSKSNAVWGFIHDGDQYETENRDLAAKLIAAISAVTDLKNRGVFLDSSTGRNDYKCQKTDKRAFYSIDENVNTAKYRVLLEVGDNAESRALLTDPAGQKRIGEAIKVALAKWLEEKGL